jgi:outer membrane protein TolC
MPVTTSLLALALAWNDLGPLLRQRYAERAPTAHDAERADLQASVADPLRFDPVLGSTLSRDLDDHDARLGTTLTQGTPFGTEVTLGHSRRDLHTPDNVITTTTDLSGSTTSIGVKQQLLKGGPLHGLASSRSARTGRDKGLLEARVKLGEALYTAGEAYLGALEGLGQLDATRSGLKSAEEQHASVTELVRTGFKAKADLLVSEAAVLRARLSVQTAEKELASRLHTLELALYQRAEDPTLELTEREVPDAAIEQLGKAPWPDEPPSAELTRLAAEAAAADAEVAWRDDLPELSVGYEVARDRLDSGESRAAQRTVSVALSMPLRSSITRDKAAIARLQADAAKSSDQQEHAAAVRQKTDLDARRKLADESLATAGRLHEMAERTMEIQRQQYADGKLSIIELRRVQDDLDAAALTLLAARREAVLARLAFAKAAGALPEVMP